MIHLSHRLNGRLPWVNQACRGWSYILQILGVKPQRKTSASFPVLLRFLPHSHHQKSEKPQLTKPSMVVVHGAEQQSRRKLSFSQANCLTFLPKCSSQIPQKLSERTCYLLFDIDSFSQLPLPPSWPQSVMGRIHLTKRKELDLDIHPWTSDLGNEDLFLEHDPFRVYFKTKLITSWK